LSDSDPGLFDLSGHVALVVGASRGIGRACAVGLATAGASVALAGRDTAALDDAAREITLLGRRATVHRLDVREVEAMPALADAVLMEHGLIDILVYASGTNVQRPALDLVEAEWDLVLDTNLKGAFFCSQAVGRHMAERNYGRIVLIGSTFSVVGFPMRAAYASSKGGLLQLARVLAIEWAGSGINVNAVGPTATRTSMNEALFQDPEWRAQVLPRIPKGRFATPQDIVGAVVYLSARASEMVTGQIILVDGGWTSI
jgi:NAD(P)-dependent dehydrogenase (short-subunit alcohol dehydrogenase family)